MTTTEKDREAQQQTTLSGVFGQRRKPKTARLRRNVNNRRVQKILRQRYNVSEIRGITRSCPCGHQAGSHKCCPSCNVSAEGMAEVEVIFGFRKREPDVNFVIPQSHCRECR